jgi:hypothetical protein
MHRTVKTRASVAMLALLAALTVLGAPAAHAAKPASSGVSAHAAVAPGCVYREVYDNRVIDELYVWNRCSYGVWVKAVIAWGPDSSCKYFEPGRGYIIHKWAPPGRYDRLESC